VIKYPRTKMAAPELWESLKDSCGCTDVEFVGTYNEPGGFGDFRAVPRRPRPLQPGEAYRIFYEQQLRDAGVPLAMSRNPPPPVHFLKQILAQTRNNIKVLSVNTVAVAAARKGHELPDEMKQSIAGFLSAEPEGVRSKNVNCLLLVLLRSLATFAF
jgi:hypothetical protein